MRILSFALFIFLASPSALLADSDKRSTDLTQIASCHTTTVGAKATFFFANKEELYDLLKGTNGSAKGYVWNSGMVSRIQLASAGYRTVKIEVDGGPSQMELQLYLRYAVDMETEVRQKVVGLGNQNFKWYCRTYLTDLP